MPLEPGPSSVLDSVFQTPGPSTSNGRKRLYTPASMPDFRSHKKRRLSMASVDLSSEIAQRTTGPLFSYESASLATPSRDRFISLRPETIIPLTISPRTNRMCKKFGILSGNRLSYKDENQSPNASSSSRSSKAKSSSSLSSSRPLTSSKVANADAFDLLRRSASTLLTESKNRNGVSVSQNLAKSKRFSQALDSPGMSLNQYAQPVSWSRRNNIAVACGKEVYYQNLDTREVTLCFRAGSTGSRGEYDLVKEAVHISWGGAEHESWIACSNNRGFLEVFDTHAARYAVRVPKSTSWRAMDSIGAVCWNRHQVTWGNSKRVFAMDVRSEKRQQVGVHGESGEYHTGKVVSMAWSEDGNYLASGDVNGVVHIWDVRAQKMLTERGKHGKMKHGGPVKCLAWCPWKSDLLATGTFYPEGIIRTWNLATITSQPFQPEKTFTLNSSVHSLIWSPVCKELLSAHGTSFQDLTSIKDRIRRLSYFPPPGPLQVIKMPKPKIVETEFTNALVVHDYPSSKRLLTLTQAHRETITAACLGPTGQDVFTASPKEQVIKMWQVWGQGVKAEKEKPFSANVIR
ncbi:cell division control protein [Coprinopsis cinerea AmutBmut pab1-1]|nr:cell division control protein [Coprinopsis cinerea AmutBmut pab1-1]